MRKKRSFCLKKRFCSSFTCYFEVDDNKPFSCHKIFETLTQFSSSAQKKTQSQKKYACKIVNFKKFEYL